ncbi:hypothetical protein HHI36_012404 [Cryptolaemus montrouzieri]|uniref:Uncharacterized protein n=1 Tax=Cryptolaemus montrouzieri TaxID=559131 RepID=A0ABD2NEI2_9CUCU
MKAFLLVVLCVLSYCQAGVLPGAQPAIVNNNTEKIPEITEITTVVANKNVPGKDVKSDISAAQNFDNNTTKSTTTEVPTTSMTTTLSPTNSTTLKPTPTTDKPTTSTSDKPSTVTPTTGKPTTSTDKPTTSTDKPTTSTDKPTPSPSTQPIVSTTPLPIPRGFDGPSFIGGIVLASGLMAIGFVAFKFYRARTELNYHTL